MNKFQLILFANQSALSTDVNNIVQGFAFAAHPNVSRVFSCFDDSKEDCLVNYEQMNVNVTPTLLFLYQVDNSQAIEVARMTGSISKEEILQKLAELSNKDLSTIIGNGDNGSGFLNLGESGKALLGLGIFNFNVNLPPFVWLLAALAGGFKAATGRKRAVYFWSGLAAVSFGNYLNAKNKN